MTISKILEYNELIKSELITANSLLSILTDNSEATGEIKIELAQRIATLEAVLKRLAVIRELKLKEACAEMGFDLKIKSDNLRKIAINV